MCIIMPSLFTKEQSTKIYKSIKSIRYNYTPFIIPLVSLPNNLITKWCLIFILMAEHGHIRMFFPVSFLIESRPFCCIFFRSGSVFNIP